MAKKYKVPLKFTYDFYALVVKDRKMNEFIFLKDSIIHRNKKYLEE